MHVPSSLACPILPYLSPKTHATTCSSYSTVRSVNFRTAACSIHIITLQYVCGSAATQATMKTEFLGLFLALHHCSPFLQPLVVADNNQRRQRQRPILHPLQQQSKSTSGWWQSHVSTHPDAPSALAQILGELTGVAPVDLAFLFVVQDQFAALTGAANIGQLTRCDAIGVGGGWRSHWTRQGT